MIKILIPELNKKIKTNVRGLWLNDNHKLYYDYLRQDLLSFDLSQDNYKIRFYNYLDKIKTQYNQEALFYDYNGIGFIYYNRDKIDVLNKVLRFNIGFNKKNLRGLIKKLLRDYKGLTIYRDIQGYILEVYYN
jgi:CRISPR-associated protein Cas8b1/Cst1 subtype I-B